MTRVLHVFGKLNRGGAETVVMSLYRAIDRERVQFDFVVHSPEEGDYEAEAISLGARIFRFPAYRIYNHFPYRKAWRAFLKEHPEYRAVHVHTTNFAYALLPELGRAGIPCRIAHAHSAGNTGVARHIASAFSRGAMRRLCTDRLACSRLAGEYAYGKRHMEGVRIVYNGVDIGAFRFDAQKREAVRAALGLGARAAVIGHVGRFAGMKNHAFLLEAFAELVKTERDAVLLLVGDGPLRAQMEEKARAPGVGGRVRFLGLRGDVPDLMQAMDALALPSLYEGLPGVVVEAQAAGLACVLSSAVTRECALVPGLCTFLPIDGGTEPWAKALTDAAKRPRADTADTVGAAGFDVREQAKFYANLYDKYDEGLRRPAF